MKKYEGKTFEFKDIAYTNLEITYYEMYCAKDILDKQEKVMNIAKHHAVWENRKKDSKERTKVFTSTGTKRNRHFHPHQD